MGVPFVVSKMKGPWSFYVFLSILNAKKGYSVLISINYPNHLA